MAVEEAVENTEKRINDNLWDNSQGPDYHDYVPLDLNTIEKERSTILEKSAKIPDKFHDMCLECIFNQEEVMRLNHELVTYLHYNGKQSQSKSILQTLFFKAPRIDQTFVYMDNGQFSLVVLGYDDASLFQNVMTVCDNISKTYMVHVGRGFSSSNEIAGVLQSSFNLFISERDLLWYFSFNLSHKAKSFKKRSVSLTITRFQNLFKSYERPFRMKNNLSTLESVTDKEIAMVDFKKHLTLAFYYSAVINFMVCSVVNNRMSIVTLRDVLSRMFETTTDKFREEVLIAANKELYYNT